MRKTIQLMVLLLGVLNGMVFPQSQWVPLNSGVPVNLYGVQFVNTDTGFVVGSQGTILKTTDGGMNWVDISPSGLTSTFFDLYFWNADTGLAVGSDAIIVRTTDGGSNWSNPVTSIGDLLYAVSFAGDIGICGGTSQSILRSTDAGVTWDVIQSGFFGGGFKGVFMYQSSIAFVAGENSIFQPLFGRSLDGGVNWNFSAFYLNGNEGSLTDVQFLSPNTGFCTARVWDGSGAISVTLDGGVTWTIQQFPNALYGLTFPEDSVAYAIGGSGAILHSRDGGNTWQGEVSGITGNLWDVAFVDTATGYAVGDNGVIIKRLIPGDTTGIISPGDYLSEGFVLEQNYPNPFNPLTTIDYQLSIDNWVTLKIYDLLGRKVKVLVNDRKVAGSYTVRWDGTNNSGNPVASGVYLYRLKIGSRFVQTRKMVLLR